MLSPCRKLGSHRPRRSDHHRSRFAFHQPDSEPAGARYCPGHREVPGGQGLRLQPDDPGQREPGTHRCRPHPRAESTTPASTGSSITPSSIAPPASPALKAKYALEGATQIVADLEAIEELGCRPGAGRLSGREGHGRPPPDRSHCRRLDGTGKLRRRAELCAATP